MVEVTKSLWYCTTQKVVLYETVWYKIEMSLKFGALKTIMTEEFGLRHQQNLGKIGVILNEQ